MGGRERQGISVEGNRKGKRVVEGWSLKIWLVAYEVKKKIYSKNGINEK